MTVEKKEELVEDRPVLYLDMDNVLADFDGSPDIPDIEKNRRDHPAIFKPNFFLNLKPTEFAKEAVRALLLSGKYEVWVASKPLWNSHHCYSEKAQWLLQHFPELSKRVVFTQDKGLLAGNFLVDDEPHWYGTFAGTFILFNPKKAKKCWEQLLEYLL